MADETPEDGVKKYAHFWFMVPKDPEATYFAFALKYRDVSMSVRLEDDDESVSDLKDLLRSVMVVAEKAREEKQIQKAVGEMQADLEELLEDE